MPRTTFAPDGTPPEITGTPPESRTLSGLPYAQCFASLSALPAAYAEEEIFALIDAHDASASALFTEKEAQAMRVLKAEVASGRAVRRRRRSRAAKLM
mmetsp:Transcript_48652/g.113885  ORF Transcript_48652/g.113885 Transcript_48652/m.113885 type:complete len:98 (+) Transcript_48652:190-483(+)